MKILQVEFFLLFNYLDSKPKAIKSLKTVIIILHSLKACKKICVLSRNCTQYNIWIARVFSYTTLRNNKCTLDSLFKYGITEWQPTSLFEEVWVDW